MFANHCLKLQNKKSIEGARRQISGLSNKIALSRPTIQSVQSDRSFRTNKSNRPIRSLFQDQQVRASNQSVQYGPTFHIGQSDISYGPTSIQANQISPTELLSVHTNQISPTDLLPYQPIRSLLWTYFRTSQSDRSDGPTFRIDQSDLSYGPTFRIVQSDLSYGRTSHTS